MTYPIFTLSLDCEGLWGMADKMQDPLYRIINYKSLINSYDFIDRTLTSNNIKCTAAFVSCFTVNKDFLNDNLSILYDMSRLSPQWYSTLVKLLEVGNNDGLVGEDFFRILKNAGHEIGWHGSTHVPLIKEYCSPELLKVELNLASLICSETNTYPKSIIFPRNKIGYLNELHSFGFLTYRDSDSNHINKKILGYLNEFNIYQKCPSSRFPQTQPLHLTAAPSGLFLNWPHGFRSIVPASVTISRWKNLIKSAVKHGATIHMWLHPHNFITAPEMKYTFSEIIHFVGQLSKSGHIKNLTLNEIHNEIIKKPNEMH